MVSILSASAPAAAAAAESEYRSSAHDMSALRFLAEANGAHEIVFGLAQARAFFESLPVGDVPAKFNFIGYVISIGKFREILPFIETRRVAIERCRKDLNFDELPALHPYYFDPAVEDERGYNALHYAIIKKDNEALKYLVTHWPELGRTVIAKSEIRSALSQENIGIIIEILFLEIEGLNTSFQDNEKRIADLQQIILKLREVTTGLSGPHGGAAAAAAAALAPALSSTFPPHTPPASLVATATVAAADRAGMRAGYGTMGTVPEEDEDPRDVSTSNEGDGAALRKAEALASDDLDVAVPVLRSPSGGGAASAADAVAAAAAARWGAAPSGLTSAVRRL